MTEQTTATKTDKRVKTGNVRTGKRVLRTRNIVVFLNEDNTIDKDRTPLVTFSSTLVGDLMVQQQNGDLRFHLFQVKE